jgi:tetratricopeptide (TPR) repeat protein
MIQDFYQHIKDLNKAGQYAEALDYFKQNKQLYQINVLAKHSGLMGQMLTALRHTENFKPALIFLETYQIEIKENTPDSILSSYAWLLYFAYKSTQKTEKQISDNILKIKITEIMKLITSKSGDFYQLLIEQFLLQLNQTEKNKKNPDWKFIQEICYTINPDKLNDEVFPIHVEKQGREKAVELASMREDWYALYSEALFSEKNYQQSIDVCESAFNKIKKFHYDNDIWFQRRIALCQKALGKTEMAISLYLEIISKKNAWFLKYELAELYFKNMENDFALLYASEAFQGKDPISYKIGLLELIGDILIKLNQESKAIHFFQLNRLLREENGWKNSVEINKKISLLSENNSLLWNQKDLMEMINKSLIDSKTIKKSNREIIAHDNKSNYQQGEIIKLLKPKPMGIDGFLKNKSGQSVYFFIYSTDELFEKLSIGLKLSYIEVPAEKGPKAIKIRLVTLNKIN